MSLEKNQTSSSEDGREEQSNNTEDVREDVQTQPSYIQGARLHIITLGVCLALFIGQMETSIISTSLLPITNDLGGFERSSWLFTAYLITYSGLLIIWAKISDLFGRKLLLVISVLLFVIFSGACGASQTLNQLIMLRWVQGIGASGIYAIGTLVFFELVPPAKWPAYVAIVTGVIALSLALGPLIGGAINNNVTWRWVFLINVPVGVVALVLIVMFFPQRLSTEPVGRAPPSGKRGASTRQLKRVDFVGVILLLAACLLLITALEEAAQGISFAAPEVLSLLVIAGVLWPLFFLWCWLVTTKRKNPEPVLPWRFLQSRVMLGMLLNTYLTGAVFMVCVVLIPQRFMTVNGVSSFSAGVRLLPFVALVPSISSAAAIFMKKGVAPMNILIFGSILQIIGVVLLSRSSTSYGIEAQQYGFQILIGSGVGCFNSALILMVPYVAEQRDLAVGTAAIAQFRLLGGVTALAIVTSVMNRWIRGPLLDVLGPDLVSIILERTELLVTLPDSAQSETRIIFGRGYNLQLTVLIGFAAAQIPATLLLWTRKPLQITS